MSDRLIVATRKGLFFVDGKRITGSAFLGDPVTMVLSDPRDGVIYAAVGHGHFGAKLHRSIDGGKTWSERPAPKYPEKPADLDDRDAVRKQPIPWNLEQIWSLEAGHASEPGVIWCGTIPGGVFRSPDGGETWALSESLWYHEKRPEWFGGGYDYPGVHSIAVDPETPGRVLVAVSCGGVWITDDSGQSWRVSSYGMFAEFMPPERREDPYIQDPHRVVQCQADPNRYWAQHHNGIFVSRDRGASWQDVKNAKPSNFGFAVAVHPKDPNTAWFAPAKGDSQRIPVDGKVVLSVTRDGGESFEVLGKGLPAEHAYDLIYRHALEVDSTGTRLALGSTSGSLWVSDDGGASFSTVSEHLPPIYAVRYSGVS